MHAYALFVCRNDIQYLHKQYIYKRIKYCLRYREDNNIGCLANYEYVYCPGGTKVYDMGSKFDMGQSK